MFADQLDTTRGKHYAVSGDLSWMGYISALFLPECGHS